MSEEFTQSGHSSGRTATRRRFLATGTAAALVGFAGCLSGTGSGGPDRGYGPWESPVDEATVTWDDLGDLEGTLVVYSGRTRNQIKPLFDELEAAYPEFDVAVDYNDNDTLLNLLREEGSNTDADIFSTQSSGTLTSFAADGLARELPEDVADAVGPTRSDPENRWTGVSGRVRAVLYNTDEFSADELPTSIFDYATDDRFADGTLSTRPNSGTFRSFILAMIQLEGEDRTREWVRQMVEERNIKTYSSGSQQAERVADGQQAVALGNQYYAARIVESRDDPPIDVAFTEGDAGALFNVSGLAIPDGTDNESLAAEFVRHVVAAEGQQFFVETNGEYPVVDGVEYVGDLPSPDELNAPDIDLNELGDTQRAQDLLREEGLTV